MKALPGRELKKTQMRTYFSNIKLRENKALKALFEGFIKPLVENIYVTEELDDRLSQALSIIFHEDTRCLYTAHVKKSFIMPGKYKLCALKHISGIKLKVKRGTRMYLRLDKNDPDCIDIQVVQSLVLGKKKDIPSFRLTRLEYLRILNYLDITEM